MSQYRQSPFANLTPVVKNLILINIILAAVAFIFPYVFPLSFDLQSILGAYYFNSPHFRVWQIVTYMFMHAPLEQQPAHLLFNMFALFMFGPILEYSLGAKRFLNLYFICGIGAIILQTIVQAIQVHSLIGSFTVGNSQVALTPDAYEQLKAIYTVPVVGASGAIFGVLVAFAMLYPNMELLLFFIPMPIKAKYVISGYILVEIFFSFHQVGNDNVAHLAHIGGALFGFIVMKVWGVRGSNNFY